MARIIDSNEKNLIGSNLKILRKQKKMSQQELSDKLETLAIYIFAEDLFHELRIKVER